MLMCALLCLSVSSGLCSFESLLLRGFNFCFVACLFLCFLRCVFVCLIVCLCFRLLACVFVCVFVYLFLCLIACLFVCLFVFFICLFVCLCFDDRRSGKFQKTPQPFSKKSTNILKKSTIFIFCSLNSSGLFKRHTFCDGL